MNKRKEIKVTAKKAFLLDLLEPFHPTLNKGERISYFTVEEDKDNPQNITFYYSIVKGGVENSKELCKGDTV